VRQVDAVARDAAGKAAIYVEKMRTSILVINVLAIAHLREQLVDSEDFGTAGVVR